MSWCDKLASTPSAGFGLDWHFATSGAILEALSPVLNPLVKDDKPQFTITRQDAFTVNLSTTDGFLYGIEPARVFIEFRHTMRAKSVSGGPPVMEMLSRPMVFTKLLPEITRRLVGSTLAITKNSPRKITRVGIVSLTTVDDNDVPPGIARFIKYVARPWSGFVDAYSFQIISVLDRNPDWTDKCIHILIKPENPDELLNLTFDWQRTFTSGQSTTEHSLKRILARAEQDATGYFEDLAEGNRFDEHLFGAAV